MTKNIESSRDHKDKDKDKDRDERNRDVYTKIKESTNNKSNKIKDKLTNIAKFKDREPKN